MKVVFVFIKLLIAVLAERLRTECIALSSQFDIVILFFFKYGSSPASVFCKHTPFPLADWFNKELMTNREAEKERRDFQAERVFRRRSRSSKIYSTAWEVPRLEPKQRDRWVR